MIEFVFGAIIIGIFWFSYTCYFKPKREYSRYSKVLKGLGYKVYELPFRPFKISFVQELKKGVEQHGEASYYEKNICKNYDLMISNVVNLITISIINPDLLKEFFSPDKMAIYPKLELMTSGMKQLLGEGIAFSEGTVWKHKRKLISKVFNFDLLKENIPKICGICDRSLDQMEKENNMQDNQFECKIMDLGSRIFTGVMMTCFFGCDLINEKIRGETLQQFIIKLIVDANEVSFSPIVLALGKTAFNLGLTKNIRDVMQRIKIFKSISQNLINKRKSEILEGKTSEKCSDLVQALVEESKKPKNENQHQYEYTNKDIIEQFSTFLIGGTDTTAHFLMMMVYYLCDYPEIEARLRSDINSVIKSDQDYTYENLKKLVYIDWIQNQTTRYYGPGTAIFLRQAQRDNFIKDIPISKGTSVTIITMANHFNEKYYKDPSVFRPERWESECDNLHPFAFVGFSGGPRTCIGKQLAYLQSKIALIKLMKRYQKITIPSGKRVMVHKFMSEPLPFNTKFTKRQAQL